MTARGFINRIRRQVGLPAAPPNIGADELQFDPVAGMFYYMPDGGGAPLIVQPRSLSGVCNGSWEEEATLTFYADVLNTVPGAITLGRAGVGDYWIASSTASLTTLISTTGQYNGMSMVFWDGFNARLIYAELGAKPAGAPAGSLGLFIRRADTGVKQEFNGSFRLRLFY